MKKTVCIALVIMSILTVCACQKPQEEYEVKQGVYTTLQEGQALMATVSIMEDNQFMFMYSVFSSQMPIGTYEITGNRLYLNVEGGDIKNEHYVFEIKEDRLVFLAKESTPLPDDFKADLPNKTELRYVKKGNEK